MIALEKYRGGGRTLMIGAVLGVVGLALTIVGFVTAPQEAYHAYLVAYLYWLGISLGALILISVFQVSGARWMVVLRRVMETMSVTSVLFALLFIPIILGREYLFGRWLNMPTDLSTPAAHHLHHKEPYLNFPFFLVRAAIYFLVWIVVSHLLHRWSTRQDDTGDLALTLKQRKLGTGAIPLLALTLTFASFDWIMSLEPLWQSTMFGVYYFAGSFLGAICVLTLVTVWARGRDEHGTLVKGDHLHNLGKLMLAFTAFWAYIGFSQYMLIWVANIPEEAEWYVHRTQGGWAWAFAALIIGHFVLPFLVLLSRDVKYVPKALAAIGIWLLLFHFLDVYWMVMPSLHPHGAHFHWTTLTAFIGVGGLAVAFAMFRARGRYTVPVRDPYLADSLRYVQP